jgi:hypothetical protein
MEFERVFYKNNFAAGVELMNVYMICTMNSGIFLLYINTDFAKSEERIGATWAMLVRLSRKSISAFY